MRCSSVKGTCPDAGGPISSAFARKTRTVRARMDNGAFGAFFRGCSLGAPAQWAAEPHRRTVLCIRGSTQQRALGLGPRCQAGCNRSGWRRGWGFATTFERSRSLCSLTCINVPRLNTTPHRLHCSLPSWPGCDSELQACFKHPGKVWACAAPIPRDGPW